MSYRRHEWSYDLQIRYTDAQFLSHKPHKLTLNCTSYESSDPISKFQNTLNISLDTPLNLQTRWPTVSRGGGMSLTATPCIQLYINLQQIVGWVMLTRVASNTRCIDLQQCLSVLFSTLLVCFYYWQYAFIFLYFIPFVYFFLFIVLCVFLYFIITAALCVLINGWMDG